MMQPDSVAQKTAQGLSVRTVERESTHRIGEGPLLRLRTKIDAGDVLRLLRGLLLAEVH